MNTETLLLAARAGGLNVVEHGTSECNCLWIDVGLGNVEPWDSYNSLHDAADLAGRVLISVQRFDDFLTAYILDMWGYREPSVIVRYQDHNNDRNQAYCHAVTECAAQVQREREKQQ